MALVLRPDVQGRTERWIACTIVITGAVWIVAFAGLLAVASRVHVDIPQALAVKLPLLQSRPDLIFAGESRTEYQVDAELAAKLTGRPAGAAVNIAYDAGEPLAVLAAIRQQPELFGKAHVVVSVAPFIFNEGVRSAAVYPQDVAARLGVFEQMTSFLPLRIGTLIRFIREAFNARLASEQHIAERASQPAAYGLSVLQHRSLTTDGRRISARIRITTTGICPVRRRVSKPRALCDMVRAGAQADRRDSAVGAALRPRRAIPRGAKRMINMPLS